ncbi:MAG: FlgD immunoglobulin-like domain containing protein [bacterium]
MKPAPLAARPARTADGRALTNAVEIAPRFALAITGALLALTLGAATDPASTFAAPPQGAPDTLTFANIFHQSLGQANLSVSAETLYVSNIGTSGEDGVAIDYPQTYGFVGWLGTWSFPAGISSGGSIVSCALGIVDGVPDQVMRSVVMAFAGAPSGPLGDDLLTILPDVSSQGATVVTYEVLLAGEVVDYRFGPPALIEVRGSAPQLFPARHAHLARSGDLCGPCDGFSFHWSAPVEITLPGGSPVSGDELGIYPADGPGSYLTQIQILAAGVPTIAFSDETLDTYPIGVGSPHRQPLAIRLDEAAPNPTSDASRLRYELARREQVHLRVFDAAGRLMATLVDEARGPGQHDATWDGRTSDGTSAGSGVYFVRLEAGRASQTIKLLRVR